MSKTNKAPVSKGVAKVPVVMQLEALECGAACLTMVLAYYGRWVPLEQIRSDCGVSRDGSNAVNILKAARSYGLTAGGARFEPEALREEGTFPCIIHWNFNHFVVLCGFKGDKVYLNDPARGNVVTSMEEFDNAFTGIALMMSPSENFQPGGHQKSIWTFIQKRLPSLRTSIAVTVVVSVITSLLGIISPVFDRIFYDRLLTGQNSDWVRPYFLALTGLSLLSLLMSFLKSDTNLKFNGKINATGSLSFMWKVLRLPMVFFTQRMTGDILSRQNSNGAVANTLVNTLSPLFLNAAMMIFYLVVMLRYSVLLTVVGLVSVVCNLLMSRTISKKRINLSRVMMRDSSKLYSTTVSGLQMMETIKSNGAEAGFFETWSGQSAAVNVQNQRFTRQELLLGMIPQAVSSLVGSVILGIGVGLMMKGSFTLGALTAFQGFYASFSAPAGQLIQAGQTLQELRTQMERIEDVMEYPEDPMVSGAKIDDNADMQKLSGAIEIRDLCFGYSPLAEPLIRDFNISIKPGSRIAFVGASGCGKSTLSKLITGLYEPRSGEILFDGKPIREIDHRVFTGSVAVVDQDIILFEDTIANNVKMWDESIEDFEMILAARDAQIHNDILARPRGYNHKLLEGGKDLSGGQRQRLEIVRVLAQDPTIIILDEATSALDAKTEYDVVKAIRDRGITCIVIAHRLSTIRDCDEIVVLDHGKVVERGTHEELMALGGAYTQLVTSD